MTNEKQEEEDPHAGEKQQALLQAAVSLAVNADVYAEDIGVRVKRLKETLDSIVFAD